MSKDFASADLTAGQLNAMVKRLGGSDEALRFLRGDLEVFDPHQEFRMRDGIFYASVVSNGTTGEEWISRLQSKGLRATYRAEGVLRSAPFKVTKGVRTQLAILPGRFFSQEVLTIMSVIEKADRRLYTFAPDEAACLLQERLTHEEYNTLGFCALIIMHMPIDVAARRGQVMRISGEGNDHFLDADDSTHAPLLRDVGFVFAVK